jgi:two-component sensor histidine kinase
MLIAAVAVLPTLIILVLNLLTVRAERTGEMHEAALQGARDAAVEIERIIAGIEGVLLTLSVAPVTQAGDQVRCSAYFSQVIELLPHVHSVSVFNADGTVRCSSIPEAGALYLGDRSYFDLARQTGKRVVGEYTEEPVLEKVGLPIAIPLTASGIDGGVAAAMIDLAWLGDRIRERGLTEGGSLTVADRSGRILTREPYPERFVGTVIPDPYMSLVTASEPGTMQVTSQDGTVRIIGYLPAPLEPVEGLYISAGVAVAEGYATINAITLRGALVAGAGVAAAVLLTFFTTTVFIRRPFRRLIETVEAWQHDDTTARTGMGEDLAEFGRAGRALDGFMDQLTNARSDRRKAEQQRELVLRELEHRVKNILATVQAVARQTFRGTELDEAARAFNGRLTAMSKMHDLLVGESWQAALISDLVAAAVGPFETPQTPRFTLTGPHFELDPKAAMALSMGLHELCTNATKYGALKAPAGRVEIRWNLSGPPAEEFMLTWEEAGGPPVDPPARKGFGSSMIEQVMATQLGGTVKVAYRTDGLRCEIRAPLARLRAAYLPPPARGEDLRSGLLSQGLATR